MKVHTILHFIFNTPQNAKIFYDAFIPEFDQIPMKRSQWTISTPKMDSNEINFIIESEDATAFRATINSLIQFAHVVDETVNLIEKNGD